MNSIADFVSKDDEIKRLNKQIDMIAQFYESFYKGEIRKLDKKVNMLVVRECRTNKKLVSLGVDRKALRIDNAAKLIKQGDMSLRNIAVSCHIGYNTVRNIVSKINKGDM